MTTSRISAGLRQSGNDSYNMTFADYVDVIKGLEIADRQTQINKKNNKVMFSALDNIFSLKDNAAYTALGTIFYLKLGEFEKAISLFTQLPQYQLAYKNLIKDNIISLNEAIAIIKMLPSNHYFSDSIYPLIANVLNEARRNIKDLYEIGKAMTIFLLKIGRYGEASAEFLVLTHMLNHSFSSVLAELKQEELLIPHIKIMLARHYESKNATSQAQSMYEASLSIHSKFWDVHLHYAWFLQNKGEAEKAIGLLNQVIEAEHDPDFSASKAQVSKAKKHLAKFQLQSNDNAQQAASIETPQRRI